MCTQISVEFIGMAIRSSPTINFFNMIILLSSNQGLPSRILSRSPLWKSWTMNLLFSIGIKSICLPGCQSGHNLSSIVDKWIGLFTANLATRHRSNNSTWDNETQTQTNSIRSIEQQTPTKRREKDRDLQRGRTLPCIKWKRIQFLMLVLYIYATKVLWYLNIVFQ